MPSRTSVSPSPGEDNQFDQSPKDFARRYAEQNEQDYQAFANGIRSGRLPALEGA